MNKDEHIDFYLVEVVSAVASELVGFIVLGQMYRSNAGVGCCGTRHAVLDLTSAEGVFDDVRQVMI